MCKCAQRDENELKMSYFNISLLEQSSCPTVIFVIVMAHLFYIVKAC